MPEMLRTQCACCGADLCFPEGRNTVRCEACTNWNDRPKAAVETVGRMKRANELCNAGQFGVAEAIYQRVLEENPDEHEARWGLVRCKYGLMYVTEQRSGKRYPTCRISRLSPTPMRSDYEFTRACALASGDVRAQYLGDAAYFDDARREILRLMDEERPYDVFICYKETDERTGGRTKDSVRAQELYQMLKKDGYRIFYAPESLRDKMGANYEAAIYHAIRTAKVMLVVGCRAEHFESTWVKSEWTRFLALREEEPDKRVIPLFEDMSADLLPSEFLNMHLQSVNLGRLGAEMDVREFLERCIGRKKQPAPAAPPQELSEAELEQAALVLSRFSMSFDDLIARANEIARTPAGAMKLCLRVSQLQMQQPAPVAGPVIAPAPVAAPAIEPEPEPEPAPIEEAPAEAEPAEEPVEAEPIEPEDEPAEDEPEPEEEPAEDEPEPEEEPSIEEPEEEPEEESESEEEEERVSPEEEAENAELLRLCREALVQAEKNSKSRDPISYKEYFDQMLKKANAGDAHAMYEVYNCYDYGKGRRKSEEEARKWREKAANAGDIMAMLEMSENEDEWRLRAEEKCRSLAEAGDPNALAILGLDFSDDEEDYGRRYELAAMKVYLSRAAEGDAEAQREVGKFLEGCGSLPEDGELSEKWMQLAARQGDVWAISRIASNYADAGDARCIEWYEKLAQAGESDSMVTLGCLYRIGRCNEFTDTQILAEDQLDPARAAGYFRKAALFGEDWYAPRNLAEMYEAGEGVEKSFSSALTYYGRLREDYYQRDAHIRRVRGLVAFYEQQGYKAAAAYLFDLNADGTRKSETHYCGGEGWYAGAWLLEHGEGIKKNLEEAKTFYRLARDFDKLHRGQAEEGLRRIEQTIREEKEAARLAEQRAKDPKWREICSLKNAAEKGDAEAMCRLALIYGDRKNGNPWLSAVKYEQWFEKAVATGNAAVLRATAQEIKERKLSINQWDWYEAAARLGDAEAQYTVGMSHYNDEDSAVCIEWLTKAAEQGHTEAMSHLASTLYLKGKEGAFKWYLKAAENGDKHAQYQVGFMYHNGYGVKKDCKAALKWLKEAADNGSGSHMAQRYLKEHLKLGRLW